MGALSIPVGSLQETPRDFHLVSGPEWWEATKEQFEDPNLVLRVPFELNLSGYRLGERLLFRGDAKGSVQLTCSRCAEPYAQEFAEPIELLLEPALRATAEIPGGIELDPDEPGLGRYSSEEIDFTPVLAEQLALNWPMQPLCKEDCVGLCPVCGTNRNLSRCGCEQEDPTRPLSRLAKLLDKTR